MSAAHRAGDPMDGLFIAVGVDTSVAGDRELAVKLADVGDTLTVTPALRALRVRFPSTEISVLVTPHTAGLLDGNDSVDRTITFPKAISCRLITSTMRHCKLIRRRCWNTRAATGSTIM